MDLQLTLIDPQRTGASVEVLIQAPAGTRLSAVTGELAEILGKSRTEPGSGRSGPVIFRCGPVPLRDDAPLGLPPLLHGTVLVLLPDPGSGERGAAPPSAAPGPAFLEAHVIAGPDAGAVVPLAPGTHSIGRAAAHPIRPADAEVSRSQAELVVGDSQILLCDSDSQNGTWVGDRRVDRGGVELAPGDRFRVGATTICIRTPDRPPAAARSDGEGALRINRGPQLRPARARTEIQFPAPPARARSSRIPWPAIILPSVLAIGTSVIWQQPGFLLFALLTPALLIAQSLSDRRAARRGRRQSHGRYLQAEARAQQALDHELERDAAQLEAARPDLARLAVTARTPTDELWCRARTGPGFLVLRLGRGAVAAAVLVRRPATDSPDQPSARPPAPTAAVHPDAPVALDLAEARVLGVCGPRPGRLGLARSLLGQISVLHSPADLRVEVHVADPSHRRDWRWVSRLPQHESRSSAPFRVVILDGAHQLRRRPEVAVALRDAARAEASTGETAAPETVVIGLDRTEPELPVECRALVSLDRLEAPEPTGPADSSEPRRSALLRVDQAEPVWFAPDLAGAGWAERLSRQLAPLRDAVSDQARVLPTSLQLTDLIIEHDRIRPTDPLELLQHWQRPGRADPVALLGMAPDGPFRVDLRRDGPHLLIGGTTGSGKSELLQTLVVSLAVSCPPDAVSFLLIDYKGGAAFHGCSELPHVGGIITDLDAALAGRALVSLTAELRRRERLLNSVGVVDIDGYAAVRAPASRLLRPGRSECGLSGSGRPVSEIEASGLPALPRLVVIVDEYRVLAEELPEFVSGLVRTATVGRSLGVHLVLATQRPAGIVSAEITANVNLRIALRVRDAADSRDLIDEATAALLPADAPGRALARGGGGPVLSFQTARVAGSRRETSAERQPIVRRLDPDPTGIGWQIEAPRFRRAHPADQLSAADPTSGVEPADLAWPEHSMHRSGRATSQIGTADPLQSAPGLSSESQSEPVSDLTAIAAAARSAAERLALAPAAPPWLPPLPNLIDLEQVLARPGEQSTRAAAVHHVSGPVRATQPALANRELAVPVPFGLADRPDEQRQGPVAWSLGQSHLAVAGGPRSGRTTTLRTIALAAGAVDAGRPRHLYVVDGSGALADLIGRTDVDAVVATHDLERGERLIRRLEAEIGRRQVEPSAVTSDVVLLVDGWETVLGAWNEFDHGRLVDRLIGVLRDGPEVGIWAAISGGRQLLTGPVSTLLAERVVLRFADPADAVLAGVPARHVARAQPPGRGVLVSPDNLDPIELQVALTTSSSSPVRSWSDTSWPDFGITEYQGPEHSGHSGHQPGTPGRLPGAAVHEPGNPRHRAPGGGRAARPGWQIPELPRRLEYRDLVAAWPRPEAERRPPAGRPSEAWQPLEGGWLPGAGRRPKVEGARDPDLLVPIGIGAGEEPLVALDLDSTPVTLVIGPPGSGRSSSLHCLAEGLRRLDKPVLLISSDRRFAGPGAAHLPVIETRHPEAPDQLDVALSSHPELTLLVDDVRSAAAPPGEPAALMDDLLTGHASRGGRLVLSSTATEVLTAYRGPLALARPARSGLLLGSSEPGDGEVFGVRLGRRPAGPPGRALLIQAGRVSPVQLALPPTPRLSPAHPVIPAHLVNTVRFS
jgi:S-DNA-T family DNA segregation ATPase FtsK/SpoIIIE